MTTLGLTGGVGMGKSAAADELQRRGLPVIDTDLLARELVEPGQPALAEIARLFGLHLLDPQGRLRRAELAQMVFNDDARRRQLEAILHPRIRDAWKWRVADYRQPGCRAVVVVIPLLFEIQAETEFDDVLCVACSEATQAIRLASRGWSPEQIGQRNRAQWPVERKMAHSHFVVWNEADLAILAEQLERVLRRIACA